MQLPSLAYALSAAQVCAPSLVWLDSKVFWAIDTLPLDIAWLKTLQMTSKQQQQQQLKTRRKDDHSKHIPLVDYAMANQSSLEIVRVTVGWPDHHNSLPSSAKTVLIIIRTTLLPMLWSERVSEAKPYFILHDGQWTTHDKSVTLYNCNHLTCIHTIMLLMTDMIPHVPPQETRYLLNIGWLLFGTFFLFLVYLHAFLYTWILGWQKGKKESKQINQRSLWLM